MFELHSLLRGYGYDVSYYENIEGGHGAGGHEGMTECEVVHVRAETHPLGLSGEEREVGEGLDHRETGGYRRVVVAGQWPGPVRPLL